MDAELVIGAEGVNVHSGGVQVLADLMVRHERQVFRLAYRLTGNIEDAKDVSQEVFLKVHRSLASLDGARDLSPWLYRVTVNAANDLLRKRRPSEPLPDFDLAGSHPTPERELLDGERRRIALEALSQLPFKERSAIVLRDIEGLSTAEVAEALGSSEATVRSQVSIARGKLRRIIDRMLGRNV
jgi:RNA polymerase sigma-70 factor, ECF subfamily